MLILIIVLSVLLLLSIVCVVKLLIEVKYFQKKISEDNYSHLLSKNKLSMVEYYFRELKETKGNPYTFIRNISNVLQMKDEEVVGYKDE